MTFALTSSLLVGAACELAVTAQVSVLPTVAVDETAIFSFSSWLAPAASLPVSYVPAVTLVVTLVVPLKYLTPKPLELLHPFTAIASECVPALTNLRSKVALFPRGVVVLRVWPAPVVLMIPTPR